MLQKFRGGTSDMQCINLLAALLLLGILVGSYTVGDLSKSQGIAMTIIYLLLVAPITLWRLICKRAGT